MDFEWKEDLEKKQPVSGETVVAPPEQTQTKNILQLSDSDEEDSFEYKKNPEPAQNPTKPFIDEFEHVTNPIGDFINNTSEKINSRYDDLISDLGGESKNFSNLEKKIDKTLDFLSSERGDNNFAPSAPVLAPMAAPAAPVVPVPAPVATETVQAPAPTVPDYFEDDSPAVSAHTSPAKKSTIVTDLDEKFISSEDLLSDDFNSKEQPKEQPKEPKEPKEESLPAKTSVLPSVQKKLEEKFSGVAEKVDEVASSVTSGVEALNSSLNKASENVAVPDIKAVSVQKLFAEYGLGEFFFRF